MQVNELIQRAMEIALNQYGNRGSVEARQLHAAVLLRRAADELAIIVRDRLDTAALDKAIKDAAAAYPSEAELREAVNA